MKTYLEDPLEFKNYSFLPPKIREKVDLFMSRLRPIEHKFLELRYFKDLSMPEVAGSLNYPERSLYAIRNRVLIQWKVFSESELNERHLTRILNILRNHKKLAHSKLLKNMNLQRSGVNLQEFLDLLDFLIVTGQIECEFVHSLGRGRPKKVYFLNSFVKSSSENDERIHLANSF